MIFDTSASGTVMPSSISEGFGLAEYERAGGRRAVRVLNDKWKAMYINHRAVNGLKQPLISAGETVDRNNIVFMSGDWSFVAPLSGQFGWYLRQAAHDLAWRYGVEEILELHRDKSNRYGFDTWLQPPPKRINQETPRREVKKEKEK